MSAVLQNISLFEGVPAAELTSLGEQAVRRTFAKDAVVIREGDAQEHVYLILSGKVKVFLPGEPEVVLDVKGPGQYFGEMMLDEKPGSASVLALEASEFAVISRSDFKAFLLKHPEVSLQVIRNLIRLARGANESAKTREQLRRYVEQLKSEKVREPESIRHWIAAKRGALVALLVVAALVFYFADVIVEMLQIQGVSVFIR
jgi:CRP-like cAMP-binding protein